MKQFIFCAVAAMAMGVMSETANTVKVTKFHQSYPYSGKATVEYTVGGTLPANAVTEIMLNADDASATFVQSNIVTGANTFTIDFASSFGGAMLLTNASFVVTIAEGLGGVQLWENGPYWAECNVGASTSEEYGYYFWWGDTVGYTRSGGTWTEDFRIVSFPMKADGTPDLANIAFDPPRERWNVQDAQMVLKCAAKLEGPWWTVPAEGGSPGTARPTRRFFKAVVLLGDAQDDPGIVRLWEGGPYWATTNIGAEEPWEYGYYFWWGDTVGYKRENNAWVASDGSSSNFAFSYNATTPLISQQTHNKRSEALQNDGWITADNVLAPEHDAAQVHWGGGWRMPTRQDLENLRNNCDWSWATNVVKDYIVRGRDEYAAASIFIPASGHGFGTSLYDLGSFGNYWSATPGTGNFSYSWYLNFTSGAHYPYYCDYRYYGFPVRPVQGSTE